MPASGAGGAPSLAGWLAFGLSCCSVGLVALALALGFLTDLPRPIAGAVLIGAAGYFLAGLVVWFRWRARDARSQPPGR